MYTVYFVYHCNVLLYIRIVLTVMQMRKSTARTIVSVILYYSIHYSIIYSYNSSVAKSVYTLMFPMILCYTIVQNA